MKVEQIKPFVDDGAFSIYEKAWKVSEDLLSLARPIVSESLKASGLDPKSICIATVGSTARREAMSASDIDLLPIWTGDKKDFPHFEDLTGKVREDLRQATDLDVSTSRNLMRTTQLDTLRKPDGIGGDDDHRRTLTQRMLILTESEQIGGGHSIAEIRKSILEAYVGQRDMERTVSKHPMTVCNDIARYYRTLCVDYKSKAESRPESWAERHAKLRNARKLWYFSTLMGVAKVVSDNEIVVPSEIFDALESLFAKPPVIRLVSSINPNNKPHASEILSIFSLYLEQMGSFEFRRSLNAVDFDHRNVEFLPDGEANPYYEIHSRSRKLSENMIEMLLKTSDGPKRKVYEWFFL